MRTCSKRVILVNVDLPLVNNMQLVPEPQNKPDDATKIDHKPEVSGGVYDYILVRDK